MKVVVLSLIHLGLFGAVLGAALTDNAARCPTINKREFWNAQPPSAQIDTIKTPVENVIILHTATEPCSMQSTCVLRTRLVQTLHIESFGWDDIGYSFLIGGDGNVYEGRSWNKKGQFASEWNYKAVGIAFIGTYNDVEPAEEMMSTLRKLLDCGKAEGFLSNNFKLFGHRQVSNTASPGDKLYALIQQWPEWAANSSSPQTVQQSSSCVTN